MLRVTEQRDWPLWSFCQTLTLIKYHIDESHSRSMLQFDSSREGREGNTWKWGETVVFVMQGGGDRQSYCTVAKDVSASAIQTISRQHSGSSLQQPLSWRRLYSRWGIREPVQ